MTDNSAASVPPTDAAAATSVPRLRGPWLVVARLGWVAATLGTIAFYVATLPSYYAYLQVVIPSAECYACGRLSPPDVQTLHHLGLSVDAYAWFVIATKLVLVLSYGVVAAVLVWRASADRVALLASLTLILFTVIIYQPAGGHIPSWVLPGDVLNFLGWVCLGLFCCIFPSGWFVPRWTPWLLLAWSALGVVTSIPAPSFVLAWFHRNVNTVGPSLFAVLASVLIGLVAAQVYRYRRVSTPAQRQQTKWVVLGAALGLGGYIAAFLVFVVLPRSSGLAVDLGWFAGTLLTLPLPLGIGIAVLRYRLFDVDVIIQRTLVYGSLSVILAAVYFGVVVGLQSLVTAVTHQTHPQPVIIVASTLLIAALFNPLRHQIQAAIDHRFYRAKYDAARTLEAFAASLRSETDLGELSEQLMTIVQETMQPESVWLWLRESGSMPRDQRTGGSD
ncbi:MAG: hypothetical protein ACLQUY_16320 [Ktedonobacterales bacterium]